MCRCNHLVARLHAKCVHRDVQRIGTVGTRHAVPGADRLRESLLEAVDVRPADESRTADDLGDRGIDRGLDRQVLCMKVGERIIEGQIKERSEAKKVYEQAKQEGKRASLVEQERPNIFTTSIANIAPRDKITIEIEYQETVRFDQGAFSLRFPMVVGPRYIPGTAVLVEDQAQAG